MINFLKWRISTGLCESETHRASNPGKPEFQNRFIKFYGHFLAVSWAKNRSSTGYSFCPLENRKFGKFTINVFRISCHFWHDYTFGLILSYDSCFTWGIILMTKIFSDFLQVAMSVWYNQYWWTQVDKVKNQRGGGVSVQGVKRCQFLLPGGRLPSLNSKKKKLPAEHLFKVMLLIMCWLESKLQSRVAW